MACTIAVPSSTIVIPQLVLPGDGTIDDEQFAPVAPIAFAPAAAACCWFRLRWSTRITASVHPDPPQLGLSNSVTLLDTTDLFDAIEGGAFLGVLFPDPTLDPGPPVVVDSFFQGPYTLAAGNVIGGLQDSDGLEFSSCDFEVVAEVTLARNCGGATRARWFAVQ